MSGATFETGPEFFWRFRKVRGQLESNHTENWQTYLTDLIVATTMELMDNVCKELIPFEVVYFSFFWFDSIDGAKCFVFVFKNIEQISFRFDSMFWQNRAAFLVAELPGGGTPLYPVYSWVSRDVTSFA